MTVTADIIHEHIETDLGDDAIDRLIDDAVAAIDERVGTTAEQTVTLRGGDRYIFLPQPITDAADISEIVERHGASEFTLDTDDWRWIGGRQVERLGSNDSPTWWGWVSGFACDIVVTYTPRADGDRRDRVTIDLVRLALQHNALGSERAGDYSSSSVEYQRERERIISELVPKVAFA